MSTRRDLSFIMADSKLDPNKSYGWTGKILRVNLTDKTVSVSPTDPYKATIGGMGLANKIMYDEVAGNRSAGAREQGRVRRRPLTATGVPLAGRTTIASPFHLHEGSSSRRRPLRRERSARGHQEGRLGCHRYRGRPMSRFT